MNNFLIRICLVSKKISGSSNSQDSFPAPGSSSASMDGYPGYPGGPGGYPPPGSTPDYNAPPMQRPPSQNTAQSPHPGKILKNFFSFIFLVLVFYF